MIISVVGAGAIGSAVALDLSRREAVTEVRVCDSRSRALQSLGELIPGPKLRPFQVEGRDDNVLAQVLENSDCVVGCTDPALNLQIAHVCLRIGAHYCDAGGIDTVSEAILRLGDEARARGVWLIPNSGLAPGLANTLCLLGIEQFDEAVRAHIRVGDITLNPEPPFDFQITTSPEKMVEDYTNPSYVIVNGELKSVPPLSGVEHIFFEEPYGLLEAFCTATSGPALTGPFIGKVRDMDVKTIKRPGHADQWRFLLALGFGARRSIDLRTHLTYRDVLLRRLRSLHGNDHPDVVLLRVLISGTRGGDKKSIMYDMTLPADEELGAVRRATSIPAAAVAESLAAGELDGGGAAVPELVLDKEQFIARLGDRGMPVRSTWHDGWLEIADLQ